MAKKVNKKTEKASVKKTAKKKTAKKAPKKKSAVKKMAVPKAKTTKAKKAAPKKVAKKSAKKKTVAKAKVTKAKKVSPNKTAIKKTTKRRVSRKRRSKLGKKQLLHFRDLLIEKLKEIVGDVNHIESEALKTSRLDASGDLSSMPIHMADIGSDNYEQEFALGLMDSERKIVNEIHAALQRIAEGTYGICEGTGEEIPLTRLEGIPWTRYCIKYAEMVEKGLVIEGERLYDEEDEGYDDEIDDLEDEDLYEDEDDEPFYMFEDEDEI